MGSTSSKFKKYIQNGDEYAAMQIYQGSPELKKSFDPNLSYGESRHHNTAMHYAARYGMKHLLRTFLNDLGGDPNKRNAFDETVLHSACSAGTSFPPSVNHMSISCVQLTGSGNNASASNNGNNQVETPGAGALTASAQERRAACIALLLQWRGVKLPSSEEKERIQMDATDRDGNSALHLAAGAGLAGGARLLLSAGAKSLTKDARGRTAAQRALSGGHARLAALIEKAMLFSDESIEWCDERWGWTNSEIIEEESEETLSAPANNIGDSHEGLRPQELREAKDRLLVDTSDMLRVSLFTAEALLRDNEWCRDVLVERWMKDATACCASAGVSLPGGSLDSEHPEESVSAGADQRTIECGICREEVWCSESGVGGCGHTFCAPCWGRYLTGRVCEGDPRPVCPAPRCRRPAPPHLLQRCLTPRTQRKYLLFDIKAFVESSRGMKWCPVAGCGRAVKLHETELQIPAILPRNTEDDEEECPGGYPAVSRGVDCGDFHFFCWDCNSEPHPPISCAAWLKWVARNGASSTAPVAAATGGAHSAASSVWLLTNCKPCPSCSSPIQKNDGCNHMKCTKCKFDFCWVCLESWKRHGSATGGYFRCTRDEAVARVEQTRGTALAEAKIQEVEAQEQWKFAVQCARFRRHEQRWLSERPLLVATPSKAKALDPSNTSGGVLEAAARELGLTRRVLIGCCPYTIILPITAPHRAAFYYAQDELERCGSRLANLIACEVIEAPLICLKRATAATRRWRLTVMRLVRPPPPPAALSAQELRMMARLLSRGRLDPRDPWRFPLGPRGEPLRVPDIFENEHKHPQVTPLSVSPRPAPERSTQSNDGDVYRINVSEYNMDLIIALEMSRLQMLEEQARRGQESDTSSTSQDATLTRNRQRPARFNISVSIGASSDNEDKSLSDDQLKLAIQLSLQEPARFRSNDSTSEPDGDKRNNDGSMNSVDSNGSDTMFQSKISDGNPSWSVTRERREVLQQDFPDMDSLRSNRMTEQDESWSRAADITVGYFLKALGRTPLDLPNLALGLDLLSAKQDRSNKDLLCRQMIVNEGIDDLEQATCSGISGFINYCSDGLKSRPPLLRSGGAGQRPPLLRQLGGRVRRSWSMGDISIRSSSTDDTNYSRMPEESITNTNPDNFQRKDSFLLHRDVTTLPHPSKSQQANLEKKVITVTKAIQIDAETQQDDESICHNQEAFKSSEGMSRNMKDNADSRKKVTTFPKNLPWGEFCCEKKCVKTNPTDQSGQTTPRYYEKKERHLPKSSMVHPETEAPKTVSVDCRGKVNPEIFDFSEKTIHLPDLNSSHLKVNTYLTKLAINKHIGLLGDSPKHCLNQNEIVGDNFRRHSDHIPRANDKGQNKVKASSSEKHIGETRFVNGAESDKLKLLKATETKNTNESPKKCVKIDKMMKTMPTLSIKICDDSQELISGNVEENNGKTKRGLETDSSNECESETGIPKSPTLYISGVSICREPSVKGGPLCDSSSIKVMPTSSAYFSTATTKDGYRITNSEQKSPKARPKVGWKDYKETSNIMATSPVIVHVTSPSLSPCSERNAVETMTASSYSPGSPELYTPSLLRSTTPTSPMKERHMTAHYSDDSLNILDMPVLPPSHFSDDVFFDEDDPGLMMDCTADSSTLRGTVYASCHGGGIMISNMATLGTLKPDCGILNKSVFSADYQRPKQKKEEALYENIYPQTDQLAFDMSLPGSPTSLTSKKSGMQKAWSARPLTSAQDFSEDTQSSTVSKLKSKSANEPERDREMFHFPKSSTDGALSSVLHVQESNLSSDDFHEALFLLERSPKTRDSKRRKRSKKRDKVSDKDALKKDRDKAEMIKQIDDTCSCIEESKLEKKLENDNCCVIDNDSPSNEQDEVSSAL